MSTLPNAALKIIHNQEEIAQTKVKKIIEHMEPVKERNFSKSKTMQVDSQIFKRHKKKKLGKGVSGDSIKISGLKNATRSNTSNVSDKKDSKVPQSNLKLAGNQSKDALEIIPEKTRSRQSTPKANKCQD